MHRESHEGYGGEAGTGPATVCCSACGLEAPCQQCEGDVAFKVQQNADIPLSCPSMTGTAPWKAFDWGAMGRWHQKGHISDPVGKAKSVVFTEEGARESERLLRQLFGRSME